MRTLFVSNIVRQDKKQFHRTDDSYVPIESEDLDNFGNKIAVVMNVSCSSRTSVCRNQCGCIIKDMSPNLTECPQCNMSLTTNDMWELSSPNDVWLEIKIDCKIG